MTVATSECARRRWGRHWVFLGILFLGACRPGPEATVRAVGRAITARDRAALYAAIDIQPATQAVGESVAQIRLAGLSDELAGGFARSMAPAAAQAAAADARQGIERYLASTGAAPSALETAMPALWNAVPIRLDSFVVSSATVKGKTAFVPLTVIAKESGKTVTVSVQLAKTDAGWQVVGVPDLAARFSADQSWRVHVADMKSDLRNLVVSQEAYFSDHGQRYASSVDLLGARYYRTHPGVTVTIDKRTDGYGWSAHAVHAAAPGRICTQQIGGSTVTEGEPQCLPPAP